MEKAVSAELGGVSKHTTEPQPNSQQDKHKRLCSSTEASLRASSLKLTPFSSTALFGLRR